LLYPKLSSLNNNRSTNLNGARDRAQLKEILVFQRVWYSGVSLYIIDRFTWSVPASPQSHQ